MSVTLTNSTGADPILDFSAVVSTITIPAGDTSAPVTIQTVNDIVYEPAENFTLSLASNDSEVTANPRNQASDHVTIGANFTNSFVGQTSSNDVANSSDTNGVAGYSLALDWFKFDNWYKSWSANSVAFPGSANWGIWNSGSGVISDWRLRATDTVARYSSGDATVNAAFVAGAACPSVASGSVAITDARGYTFLVNAIEINQDGIGNDNGLCETGDACIYAPNIGSYQGHGDYYAAGTCTFTDGTVSGVKMYAYPINGYVSSF